MTRRQKLLAGGAAAAALVGLFLLLFERVESEVEAGPGAAALENDLLAAERLFTRLGAPARSLRGPFRLPGADHALVLLTPRIALGEERREEILDWVRRGGHLITAPRPADAPGSDQLLERLLVQVVRRADGGEDGEPLRLSASTVTASCQVAMAGSPRLLPRERFAPAFTARYEGEAAVVRYRFEEGWITVLADPAFLTNGEIGRHEHARFAWELLTAPSRPAGVWLVYREMPVPLGRIVRRRAWTALLSGAVWLAVWLWYRGVRFGPALAAPPLGRRSLIEHLAATGGFLYRHGEGAALLAAVRRAVLLQAAQKHPTWRQLGGDETADTRRQVRYLAELAGLRPAAVAHALEGPAGDEPAELADMIFTLEEVRRSL